MNRVQAKKIDAHVFRLEIDDLEALLEYLPGEIRAPQRARACVEEHVLADEPFGATNRDLQRRRAGLAADVGHAHAIGPHLLELCRREVDNHVGRDVVCRIVHLIQHLLLDGTQVDCAPRAGNFGDHRAAIGADFTDREAEIPRLGHILVARV